MGLAKNPGDLRTARFTCGQKGCHPDLVDRVEKSLMATNAGILKVMQTLWPHSSETSVSTVRELMDQTPGQSLALDHFRKMCGGC
ncbi:amino acid ABC transporter substrate-binding protein, partial [Desulfobacteraceae bacterium SEEP-SAG9]